MGITPWERRGAWPEPLALPEPPADAAGPQALSMAAAGDDLPDGQFDLFDEAVPSQEGGGEDPPVEARGVAALGWDELPVVIKACTACGLCAGRAQAVPGVGHPQADWLIVGEAPGADEDRLGEPFVGRSGKLLDRMLFALGLDRATVFIANVVKCRPPKNRDPKPDEISACWPYLRRQIQLIRPQMILVVGRVAAQTLLDTQRPMGQLRGRLHRLEAPPTPLVATYHPAYLLRSPGEKRKVWADLQLAKRSLAEGALLQGPGQAR
ncbi:MAG: uracil-DNA glycosylase [Candidatus Competibacterales bacterium]